MLPDFCFFLPTLIFLSANSFVISSILAIHMSIFITLWLLYDLGKHFFRKKQDQPSLYSPYLNNNIFGPPFQRNYLELEENINFLSHFPHYFSLTMFLTSLPMKCMEVLIKYTTIWNNTWIVWMWLKDKVIENNSTFPEAMALSLNEQGQKRIKFIEKEHSYFLFFRVVVFIYFFQPTASKTFYAVTWCTHMHCMYMFICLKWVSWNKTYYISHNWKCSFLF